MKQSFKPRIKRKFIGTYRPKIDGWAKAAGRAEYLDDIATGNRFPGMLFAKVLRSPYANCRVKRLDVSRAEQLRGVHTVLTYEDPEVAALKPTTNAWTSFNTVSYDRMYWPEYRDRRVLDDRGRWVGDEVGAVVVAETEEIAEEALGLLDIEWEVLPFVLDPMEAMKPEAPVIHPEINPDGNVLPPEELCGPDVFVDRGDVDKAFAKAHVTVEFSSDYHRADHACLDTRGCLIQWKGDSLTCWHNFYQGDQTRMYIAQMLDMPLHKVRVICPFIGGSFGRGNQGDQLFFIFTAIAARRTGRPVKFKHTRLEDFHDTRNAIVWSGKMSAKKDGTITAGYFKGIGNSGAYVDHTMAALKYMTGFEIDECLLAHIPNMRMEAYAVYTNTIPGSCMRGVGNNQFNFALGLAVDLLAEKLSMDPVELTIKNFGNKWEGLPNKSLESLLKEGAKRIGWERRPKQGQGAISHGPVKKRGMGFSFHDAWHTAWQELPRGRVQLSIRLNPDLTVNLQAPMAETGVGSNSCAVFACAEHLRFLGVRPEDVQWVEKVDTETGMKDMVQTDSSVSYLHAELMPEAAAKMMGRILEMASPKLGVPPKELTIEEGRIFQKHDPDKGMTVKELLWNETMVPILVTVDKSMPEEVTGVPFEASFAEVEVDTETGRIDVLKLVILNDCGTVMFASGAEAQQIGGQCMALGETLTEEIVYDEATGIPLNFNWIDYKVPTMADFPDVEAVPMEVWKGGGEYGACGIGEAVTTCTPRAIANAIYNAVGVRIDKIPITPERVLYALSDISRNTSPKPEVRE